MALSLALAAPGCGRGGDAAADGAAILDPAESYRKRTCYRCHGDAREGTEIGPPLTKLAEHWDADRLARYIENPAPFRKGDPRMEQMVDDYRGRLMKGYKLQESERRALSAWLLDDSTAASGAR